MRIGIIGTGNVGMTLGNALVRAGHDVVYGSRDDGRTAPHAGALLGSIRGAVLDAEVVILATPSWSELAVNVVPSSIFSATIVWATAAEIPVIITWLPRSCTD